MQIILRDRTINMARQYHEYRNQSKYLSNDPDDAGLRYRVSGDLLLCYRTARGRDDIERGRTRSKIMEFTHGTSTRMAAYLRECVAPYSYMHTLTYPSDYPSDGHTVKYHLRRYCQELMRISKRNGRNEAGIFWFIEFQKRGAPHFHLLTTDFYSFRRCQLLWYTIVNSGDIKHLKAGVRVERLKKGKKGMIAYAKKYAAKQEQKKVPEDYISVGRFYGMYGNKKRVAAGTTFYKDLFKKDGVTAYFDLLNVTINRFKQRGHIISIKVSEGFRMFHISNEQTRDELIQLINESDHFLHSVCTDLVDAEIDSAEPQPRLLTDEELRRAKRAYLLAKYGEISF